MEGDYNFKGSDLDRGVNPESRQTAEEGYSSTLLDKTKIPTPPVESETAVTLDNTEGDKTLEGNFNLEGSDLDRGVKTEPRDTEDGYGSTLLDKTKIPTPEPQAESAVTLQNKEGGKTLEGNYNFEGSDLVDTQPRQTEEDGYGSTYLDKTKIPTPAPQSEGAITLENTEGAKIMENNYNFEGSDLDRGLKLEPKSADDGYSSTFLEKTKIEAPEPSSESAITLENTEGDKIVKGDYNFEGSELDRGVDGKTLLDETKIETPPPTEESAVTLDNST